MQSRLLVEPSSRPTWAITGLSTCIHSLFIFIVRCMQSWHVWLFAAMWSLVPGYPLRRGLTQMANRKQTDLHRQTQNRELTRDEVKNLTEEEAAQRWSQHVVAGVLTKKELKRLTADEKKLRREASDEALRQSRLQVRCSILSTPEVLVYLGTGDPWYVALCDPEQYHELVFVFPERLIGYEKLIYMVHSEWQLQHIMLDHCLPAMFEHLMKRTRVFQPGGAFAHTCTPAEIARHSNSRAQADGSLSVIQRFRFRCAKLQSSNRSLIVSVGWSVASLVQNRKSCVRTTSRCPSSVPFQQWYPTTGRSADSVHWTNPNVTQKWHEPRSGNAVK
jgi:hypothetical protein